MKVKVIKKVNTLNKYLKKNAVFIPKGRQLSKRIFIQKVISPKISDYAILKQPFEVMNFRDNYHFFRSNDHNALE